jgi:hypothetical protein
MPTEMIDEEYETFFPLLHAMIRDTSVADQEKENLARPLPSLPPRQHRGQGDQHVGSRQSTQEVPQWVWLRSQRGLQRELSELWWCIADADWSRNLLRWRHTPSGNL